VPVSRKNVSALVAPPGYTHLAVVTDARLVFVAGQVPLSESGELVGADDANEQAHQCMRNLVRCLSDAGATADHVVRLTVYVVATPRQTVGRVWHDLMDSEFAAFLNAPATLLGVSHLGYEGQLVEIECTAAVPLTVP
jgi:enamine deaminase RidA (YjgF/YER057c/UK114 family)